MKHLQNVLNRETVLANLFGVGNQDNKTNIAKAFFT